MCIFELLIIVDALFPGDEDVQVALRAAREFDWITVVQRASAARERIPRDLLEGAVESALLDAIERAEDLRVNR